MKKIVAMVLSLLAVLLCIPISFQVVYRAQGRTVTTFSEQDEELMVTVFR